MTDAPTTFPAPRIEAELAPAERLQAEAAMVPIAPRNGPGTLALASSGVAVLGAGGLALGTAHLIAGAFAISALLGWGTIGLATVGVGLIVAAIFRELRGLLGLRRVDRLRAQLASNDLAVTQAAALAWLEAIGEAATLAPALRAADTPAAILALLRPSVAGLRMRGDALSATASWQVLAAIAAIPSPMFDGLLVGWRGVRLVRQVAELHGLRPGALATAALMRRTLLSAALVTATDIAANTAAHALFSNKLLGHVVGDTAAALVAARRMRLLARAAAAACSPM